MATRLNPAQNHLLQTSLTQLFGDFDAPTLATLTPLLEWVEIRGGECLLRQNEPGNSMYFVISGRLQAVVTENGQSRKIGEIMRGETVGETALITNEPRNASVFALRDTVLVRLSKTAFEQVINKHPAVALNMARCIIQRLKKTPFSERFHKKPVNICLLPLHTTVDLTGIAQKLHELLLLKGTVLLLTSDQLSQLKTGTDDKTADSPLRQFSHRLDDLESQYEYVLLVADPADSGGTLSEWSQFCVHQADDILLLADARQPADLSPGENQLSQKGLINGQAETLILIHPTETLIPRHTSNWLNKRPQIHAHYHIRQDLERDLARLSRILSNTAIGFVLAGGGARGFAHVGVLKALQDYGIPIDFVAGTSVGGLIASAISFDQPAETVRKHARKGALFNPSKDYNFLPLISLIRGQRMEQMIRNTIGDFLGGIEPDIEDSWITFFTLSSNYTQARPEIHTRGSMIYYLRATTAIPGVFPPIIDGDDFLVDGGSFNNFPADVMSRMPVGKIIGVDLTIDKPRKLTITSIPSPTALLRDRFRSKKQRKYRLPSLSSILLNSTLLYSASQRGAARQLIDLYFNPDVSRFSLMKWSSYDKIVEKGYEHAMIVLKQMSDTELAAYRA
ncbi:patatin-like phospholipase family protein [Larkinella terrae]|uniref:Cyclic nucleotide-binding domain-containing protein n=1 Tax=Larkinella terrae TaxID=2025311 RepID=A0A7K0EQI9_9BACT|nr:patatin-like phospholipase family protein [Larkinella terrae]MRS64059.1 cyclic nucleotide-binding domain-containing protein [Larkinella terrae]